MTPEALARIVPEAVPGIRLLPVVHARAEMAAVVRAVLDAVDPSAVAVELPTSFAEPVAHAIARLPRISLVLAHPETGGDTEDEEAVVWTAAPADPFAEALRWAAERGRPGLLVDPDLPYPERHDDAVPDPYALLEIGPVDYLGALVEAMAPERSAEPASEADRRREAGMAYHLRRALDRMRSTDPGSTVLALVGAAHVRRLAAALAGPVAVPFVRVRRRAIELRHVEPKSLTALLPDPPLVHAAWELLRGGELAPEPAEGDLVSEPVSIAPSGSGAGLTLITREGGDDAERRRHRIALYAAHRAGRRLPGCPDAPPAPDRRAIAGVVWRVAARSYTRQTHEAVAPWQERLFFDFGRRLARVEGRLATGLYGWITAGRGVGDDNLAWEVLDAARAYPGQAGEAEIPTVSVDGSELELSPSLSEALGTRRVRFRRWHFRIKRRPVAVPVRERATTDDPADWLEGFRGGGICSYPPEDLVVEGFGRRLRVRAKGLLSAEGERSEPFSTSLLDGIDVRETLRHPEDPRIWVRELGRPPGEAGSVVVIFDPDLEPGASGERYPYRMTWLGEHEGESDMAFYATDPAAQVVGPGILRATYGGFVMTLPPGRLFDVWRDPDYRYLHDAGGKEDVLLAAAIDYSEEKLVVHVAAKAPRAPLRSYARAQGKRIVHLPIGSLSPAALRRIRTLHVLVGRDKRKIAARYVW